MAKIFLVISRKKLNSMAKLFLSLAVFFFIGCSSLLYYPSKDQLYDPKQVKLEFEEVQFNDGKNQLHAWWFPSRNKTAKGTFVYFHGNAENLSSHFLSLSWLPENGFNYFIFDYPGYGKSQGEPSPEANVSAGIAALKWVHSSKDERPLIVYGQSMGGIIAMRSVSELKEQIPFQVLIADGTFSSFQRIARQKLAEHWLTWLFQPLAYLVLSDKWAAEPDKISPIPLLVMHGDHDEVIPIKSGERIFNDAKEPKAFIPIAGGHHGDLFWVDGMKYRKIILDKIESLKAEKKEDEKI